MADADINDSELSQCSQCSDLTLAERIELIDAGINVQDFEAWIAKFSGCRTLISVIIKMDRENTKTVDNVKIDQAAYAKALDCSLSTYQRFENGKGRLSLFCRAFKHHLTQYPNSNLKFLK